MSAIPPAVERDEWRASGSGHFTLSEVSLHISYTEALWSSGAVWKLG